MTPERIESVRKAAEAEAAKLGDREELCTGMAPPVGTGMGSDIPGACGRRSGHEGPCASKAGAGALNGLHCDVCKEPPTYGWREALGKVYCSTCGIESAREADRG
jgi:hypothetical protein